MRAITLGITAVAIIGIGYFAYGRFMPHGGGAGPMGGAPPVSVAEVIQRNVQLWHEFSGRLVAVDQVEIRPQVSGTIEKVYFKDGAMVQKGDPLFTIDPRPYQAAYDAVAARASLAESELKRGAGLIADKAIPQHDFDQRKNNAAIARADLATAKLNLDYTHITAPISGKASRAEITEGNLVASGSSAPVLTTIVTSTPIYADFDADEATYIQYIPHNADTSHIPVMMGLSGEAGTPHTGTIQSFDNRVNTTSGTIRMRAVFDNADGTLIPGLYARIRLGSPGETQSILITDRAVGTDQSKKFVLVVGDDKKVVYREVTLGPVVDGLRVVTDGLKPGEKIVVNGTQRARPGQEVTPEVVPMEDKDKALGTGH
jgi:multidrug efflux system membrane fusion protein